MSQIVRFMPVPPFAEQHRIVAKSTKYELSATAEKRTRWMAFAVMLKKVLPMFDASCKPAARLLRYLTFHSS